LFRVICTEYRIENTEGSALSSSAPEARAGCVKIEGTVSIIHAAGVPAVPTEGSYLADGKVAMRWRRWRKYSGLTGRLRTSSITGEK
jgi:hypothetical protein